MRLATIRSMRVRRNSRFSASTFGQRRVVAERQTVAQHVDFVVVPGRVDLDPRNDGREVGRELSVGPHRVVIGDREDPHAARAHHRDQFLGRERPVRLARVRMEIDDHARPRRLMRFTSSARPDATSTVASDGAKLTRAGFLHAEAFAIRLREPLQTRRPFPSRSRRRTDRSSRRR